MSNLLNKLYWSFCWRDVHSIIILDTNDKTPSCDIFTVLFWEWWEIQTLLLLNRPVNKPKLILAPITKLINLTQMQCKHCFFLSQEKACEIWTWSEQWCNSLFLSLSPFPCQAYQKVVTFYHFKIFSHFCWRPLFGNMYTFAHHPLTALITFVSNGASGTYLANSNKHSYGDSGSFRYLS